MRPGRTLSVDPGQPAAASPSRRCPRQGARRRDSRFHAYPTGVGASQVSVAQHRAHLGWRAAGKEQLPSARERGKASGVGRSLLLEGLVDDESPAGEPSRRAQRLLEVDRPPTIQRQGPGRGRSGYADGQPTGNSSAKGIAWPVPGSTNVSSSIAAGAVSRPSMVSTLPERRRSTRRTHHRRFRRCRAPSTPRAAAVATAASTALPPRSSTFRPISVAYGSSR